MQWDDEQPNAGFSAAPPDELYLPQDADPARPTVAAQQKDPDSTLNLVRRLLHLRRSRPALRPGTSLQVLAAGYPLVYLRDDTHLVVVNPSARRVTAELALDPSSFTALELQDVRLDPVTSRPGRSGTRCTPGRPP
jgi:glycosidase